MHRQSDINQAFRESVLRNSKGFQYLHTKDFVSALRRRGLHFTAQRLMRGYRESRRTLSTKPPIIAKTVCGCWRTWGGCSDGIPVSGV